MRIIKTPFKGIIVSLQCDCGGDIEPVGITEGASKYKHVCTDCKKEYYFDETFPHFDNMEIDNGQRQTADG